MELHWTRAPITVLLGFIDLKCPIIGFGEFSSTQGRPVNADFLVTSEIVIIGVHAWRLMPTVRAGFCGEGLD